MTNMHRGFELTIMNILRLIVMFFCLCFYNTVMAEETPRKITFGVAGITEQDRPFKLGTKILKEISKKIGHEIELIALPHKRAKFMLKKGQIDAELARVSEYAVFSDSLIMVNEPIVKLPFYMYSTNSNIKITDIKDIENLKRLRVVTLRGQEFLKRYLNDFNLSFVDSIKSGFLFLYKDRADIFITNGISASTVLNSLEQKKLGINRIEPPIAIVNGYTFFTANNAEIAKKFEKALIEIKEEGIYDKIFSETK